MSIRFGLLLPHFGRQASPANLVDGARTAESLGFDSVWVRDHLIFEPHGEFEAPDTTFYEALTTLTVVGASTSTLMLGTGALIPIRHPIHTARIISSMSQFFPGRLILGLGAGNSTHEFRELGLDDVYRPDLIESHARVLRKLWNEDHVDHEDAHVRFTNVTIKPRPAADVPLWYCGNTPASVRRAVAFYDGWLPGRINLLTLAERVRSLQQLAQSAGRAPLDVGVIPITSIAPTTSAAMSGVDVGGLLEWANNAKFWVKPAAGRFVSVRDLEGLLVAGTPESVVADCLKLHAVGVDHVIFDLRLSFDRWLEQMELLGTQVLERVRREVSRSRGHEPDAIDS